MFWPGGLVQARTVCEYKKSYDIFWLKQSFFKNCPIQRKNLNIAFEERGQNILIKIRIFLEWYNSMRKQMKIFWAQTFLTWSFPGSTVVDWGIQVVLCAHKSKYLSTYSFHLFQSIDWSTRMVKAGILIFFLLTILGATLAAAPGWSIWYQHIHNFLIIDSCNYICM